MSEHTDRFIDRRSGKDRRDRDEFLLHDRRSKTEEKEYFTIQEAAEKIGVSPSTIILWIINRKRK